MRKKNTTNTLKQMINNLKFKSENLCLSNQLVIIWSIIWFISLYIPWVIDTDASLEWNSFSSLSWNVWYLLTIVLFLPIFIIFSTNYKEKLKLYSNISIKNHFMIITSWLVIISFCILSLNFITWLQTLSKHLSFWNWIILTLTSWIIIFIWWMIIRKKYYKNNSKIILNNWDYKEEKIDEKNNMILPF